MKKLSLLAAFLLITSCLISCTAAKAPAAESDTQDTGPETAAESSQSDTASETSAESETPETSPEETSGPDAPNGGGEGTETEADSAAETPPEYDKPEIDEDETAPAFDREKRVLADYFYKTVGTPMEMPYSEIVLYESDPDDLIEVYENGGSEYETITRYSISKDAYQSILNVILEHKMDTWNDIGHLSGFVGAVYAVRFWDGNEQIRVSSDRMPGDGMQAFHAVESAMYGLLKDAELIETIDVGKQGIQEQNEQGIVTERQLADCLEELDASMCADLITVRQETIEKDGEEFNAVNVYLGEGYFPGNNLSIKVNNSILWNSSSDPFTFEDEVTSSKPWLRKDGKQYCTAMYTSDDITLKDWSLGELSGKINHYKLPEHLLFEDEKGRYFFLEDYAHKCYLDGTEEIEHSDGTSTVLDETWVRKIMMNGYARLN